VTGTRPAPAPQTRAPRTRTPWRAAFFALAGLGVLAGVAWALLGSRLLVVRSVTVTGTHLVSPAQVLAAADVPDGTSLVGVNTAQVAQRVEAIRQVASATVTKDWPDRLVITVRERVPVMAVRMAGGGYDLVDPTGVIVRWSTSRAAGLPLYLTSLPGSALRGDPSLAAAAAVLAELPSWLSRQVAEVSAGGQAAASPGDEPQVTLYLIDRKTVLWGGTDRASQKDRELAILMRDPARYFDVSAPGTVVTK
jgi:cell division protein FtsQ